MDVLQQQNSLNQLDLDSIIDHLPECPVTYFFQPPVSVADTPSPNPPPVSSPNPSLSNIENFLMTDSHDGEGTASPVSDYHKRLEKILVHPLPPSDKDRVDPSTPEEVPHEPISKKQIRQMRNRDAAVKSRERKKMYVKNLETKTRYFEGECRRLEHLLHCCYAENHALRLCLQSRGAFAASITMQESAVLLLESLLLGSLLWFMGIMCQLSLPLLLWLTVLPPRENMTVRGLRRVALKRPNSNIKYFMTHSFVKSRRCQASRRKMKVDFIVSKSF